MYVAYAKALRALIQVPACRPEFLALSVVR